MKLIVTKIQPSKFQDRNTIINKAQKKQFSRQKIVIGRGDCLQQQKNHESDIFSVDHKSISRKHALISVPYIYSNCNKQLLAKCMTIKANNIFPKSYNKLGGIWPRIPLDLRSRIREYSGPENVLLIKDLNSRYGLYQKVQRITILNSINTRNSSIQKSETNQLYNFYNVTISNKSSFTLQMGNQLIQVLEINFNMAKSELQQYNKYLQKKFKQVHYYCTDRLDIDINGQNPQINYCSVLLKEGDEKTSHICIILQSKGRQRSKKVSIGRNSMCSIQINKSSISRKQTSLYLDEDSNIIIQDQNSTNGTWLKCDKIKYKIDKLDQNLVKSISNYSNSEIYDAHDNFNEANSCVHGPTYKSKKNQSLIVKLGEIRFDIQIQNNSCMWNDLLNNIRNRNIGLIHTEYTKILDELSLTSQICQNQDQNSNQIRSGQKNQYEYCNMQKLNSKQKISLSSLLL